MSPTPGSSQVAAAEVRESRRQRAVESLGLTEAGRNPHLDRVARVARATFGVDFSSITVFDHDRALYVGGVGFDATESRRVDSPCQLVIESGEVVTTDDARIDTRFDDVAGIRADDLGFYAGHPLTDGSGNVVGSFCLIDKQPRILSEREMTIFVDLAGWAQDELLADADATRARATQQALLPTEPLESGKFRVVGACVPANSVGGDYFDFGLVGSLLHVAIGDVMGKGAGAAIIGAATRAACRAVVPTVESGADLGRAVGQIENAMIGDLQRTGTFVTYFHVVVDVETAILHYVDAGAGLAILVRKGGAAQRLVGSGLPLGIERQQHTAHSLALRAGDRLVLVSDGLLDVLDDPMDWIEEVGALVHSAAEGTDALDLITDMSRSRVPIDDVTVVVLEYRP